MSAHDDDSRIALLRQHLGDRFERFIGALDAAATEPLFWQARVLDEIEAQSGVRFSRSPAVLAALLRPLLPVPARMDPEAVPAWITVESLEGSAPLQGEGTVTGGKPLVLVLPRTPRALGALGRTGPWRRSPRGPRRARS